MSNKSLVTDSVLFSKKEDEQIAKYENQRCKWVDKVGISDDIDIIRNYRFVTHPTKKNTCYFKRDDPSVEGICSKQNENYYNKTFGGVVKNIRSLGFADAISAESIPMSECGITFDKNAHVSDLNKWLIHVDSNHPRFKRVRAEIERIIAEQNDYIKRIEYEKKQQEELEKERQRLEKLLAERRRVLNEVTAEMNKLKPVVDALLNEIRELEEAIRRKVNNPPTCDAPAAPAPAPASPAPAAPAPAPAVDDTIAGGACIRNACKTSQNQKYKACQQGSDGHFVVYNSANKPIWASQKFGGQYSDGDLCMQNDGNLVTYKNGKPYWASNTWSKSPLAPYKAIMQNDGNFVIYNSQGKPTWATNTVGR
jgi:hypothetical protein